MLCSNKGEYGVAGREIYHVHTWRCRHGSSEPDESYIQKAIELGADRITFTDHAPFPGDPFSNRMRYSELKEYITSLKELRNIHEEHIQVCIGLEIEYLPEYESYYEELKGNPDIELLMIGQHHYELGPGKYSFQLSKDELKTEDEYHALAEAQIAAMETKLFDVLAHPERTFRKAKSWNKDIEFLSNSIINAAMNNNVLLEYNLASAREYPEILSNFWNMVPAEASYIVGCDAHNTSEVLLMNADRRQKKSTKR